MATQPKFSADELILMLDYVLDRKAGIRRPIAEFSDVLRGLPANAKLARNPAFRSVAGLNTSLGYMEQIDGAGATGHQGMSTPGAPSSDLISRQCGTSTGVIARR